MLNIRALAAKAITETLENRDSFNSILQKYKKQCSKSSDQALLQALCFGVLRWYPRLQWFLQRLLEQPLKKKEKDLEHLLYVGMVQMLWMRIPEYSAVSETVEACVNLKKPWAKNLVNAILRNFQRKKETLQEAMHSNEEAYFAHPKWWIEYFKSQYPLYWQAILQENNTEPPLTLRINLSKISRQDYQTLLRSIPSQALADIPAALHILEPQPITSLPGYKEGLFSVQDAAPQLVLPCLELQAHQRVLDVCSAPGGKLGHMLENTPSLECLAIDISADRLTRIQENLNRLHLKATIKQGDTRHPALWWDNQPFDRILCDLPCSASGIIRRHPDIKILKQYSDILDFAKQQFAILQAMWPLLKQNGILVYCTCSIFVEENEQVMEKFLSLHRDAQILDIPFSFGIQQRFGKQVLPIQHEMDGFYYARVKKM